METVLYADILFLVNFAMDFISLSVSANLGARPKNPVKICIAASLGAVYAIFATVSTLGAYINFFLAIAVGAAMCAICFGYIGLIPFVRQYAIFWCCSALLGGIMTALLSFGKGNASPTGTLTIVVASVGILIFMIKAICCRAGCKSIRIKVSLQGKTTTFDALCDSGNMLRDPFSKAPVILASHEILSPLMPKETIMAMLDGCDAAFMGELKLRLIPQKSESGSRLLYAFFPDSVIVSTENKRAEKKCLIAVSPHNSTYFAGFAATAPSILIP